MDDLRPEDPRQIGPYWLEGRLGSGGMGNVYLGRSPGGRHVAIKVIRAELAEDPEFRARFAREVTSARKVSGIFTAEVVDADLHGPAPWLATSFVVGPTLADAVAARGPMLPAAVLKLAAGLAEGLVAIHSAGVVHRDLKPANVLLADDGPRLIDFGIARAMDYSALTLTGMVIGSPGFMSPEQAQGRETGPPSDIFSLGAVLAFAATGTGPFGGGSGPELLYRLVSGEPDTSGIPGEIRPLIGRCLAKDPRQRPTAAQLLAELSIAGPTAYTPPAAPAYPPTEPAWPAAGPAAAPDVRQGAQEAVRSTRTAAPPPPPAPPPPAPPQPRFAALPQPPSVGRSRRGWYIAAAVAVMVIAAAAGAFVAWQANYRSNPMPASSSSTTQESPASSKPPTSATSSAATMHALGVYVARSASVRPTVQPALDGVRNCSQTAASGQATLQQVIGTREDILVGLRALSPSGLPNGAQLTAALTAAMQESVTADRYYQAWMADFAHLGYTCGSDPGQNPNYAAGQDASVKATTAKKAFLDIWNPLAPSYGEKTYSSTDF
jgi:serine/threonine protein kinase